MNLRHLCTSSSEPGQPPGAALHGVTGCLSRWRHSGARPWLCLDALKLRDHPARRKDQVLWLGPEVWKGHLGSSCPGCASQKHSKDPKAEESFVTAARGSERSRKRSASRAVSS